MKTQINAKLITRLFGTALIVALAGKSVAASPFTETRSAVVKFADLNLDTPQGVIALYKRIHSAAEGVCGVPSEDRVFLQVASAEQKCVSESETRAIDSINNFALAAYYSKKTGRPMPVLASNQTK
jgi:UrcA family protein